MQTKIRNILKLTAVLLLVAAMFGSGLYQWKAHAAASLPATPCTSLAATTTVTCDLVATTGTVTLSDGSVAPIWGYADAASGVATLPGPVLIVNQGDTVTVNLTNQLGEASGLLFQGQDMIPDTTGAAASGGTKSYTFTASKPGTYLYEASALLASRSAHQSAMGLYGALVVRPVDGTNTPILNQAYASAVTAFDEEALLVLSELDPALNNSASPAAFDMRNYHPSFYLINGESYPDTDAINVAAGSTVLLRLVNAGLQSHSISLLGLQQSVIALDGSPFNFARKLTADTMFPGQTSDVLVNTSALAGVGTKYAVYDSAFILSNNTSSGFGGMLTFINLTSGTVIVTDTVGPLTSGMTLSSVRVAGGLVTLNASVSEALSCPVGSTCTVQDAEYFMDSTGTDGSGTHFTSAVYGTETVSVSADIDVDALALATGSHTIYVHGQDNSGNWGAFSSIEFAVDKDGPAIIGMQLLPNPSDGSSVLLEVSGDDRASGNSFVDAAEYFVGASGADGAGTAMLLETFASTSYFTSPLAAGSTEAIFVHAKDDMGNWGPFSSMDLVVDLSGPVTSVPVVATPDSTNGGFAIDGTMQSVNSSIAAVRITATFTDDFSSIQTAEGFIDSVGADGMGFPFISVDGLFDSLVETGYADIPLSTFWLLSAGPHTIFVHALDASGNWGAPVSVTVTRLP